MSSKKLEVGVDLVAIGEESDVSIVKTLATPRDPSLGIINAPRRGQKYLKF